MATSNLQLLHGHCHDQKTRFVDNIELKEPRLREAQTQLIEHQELCEAKRSRTVLKQACDPTCTVTVDVEYVNKRQKWREFRK